MSVNSNPALAALAGLGFQNVTIPANEPAAPVQTETVTVDQSAALAEQVALGVTNPVPDVHEVAPVETVEVAATAPAATVEASAPVVQSATPASAAASGPAFSVGAASVFTMAALPSASRTVKATAPAYDVSDLVAPVDGAISAKLFPLESGDIKKLARSVRSFVTGVNRATREAKAAAPFYSSYIHKVDGVDVGIVVYRSDVDPAPAKSNEAE